MLAASITIVRGQDWYDSSFNQKLTLTVDSSFVDGDLTDFPVLVYFNDTVIDWGDVQNDLDDFRFVSASGQLLSHEVESYVYGSYAYVWVKLLTVSASSDTTFYFYYDNPGAVNVENASDVWLGYSMVHHLKDETSATVADSTVNGLDGDKQAADHPLESTGLMGKSQTLDGSNDYIYVPGSGILDYTSENFTVEMWLKPTALSCVLVSRGAWQTNGYYIQMGATGFVELKLNQVAGQTNQISSSGLTTGSWSKLTIVRYGSTCKIYFNGSDATGAAVAMTDAVTSSQNFYLGRYDDGSLKYAGLMEETRIKEGVVLPAQVKAEYYSETQQLISYSAVTTYISEMSNEELFALIIVFFVASITVAAALVLTVRKRK